MLIIDIIFYFSEIAIIIYSNKIYEDTLFGNPFKFEKYYDKKNYFKSLDVQNLPIIKKCKCQNEILNYPCTVKQILLGCIDITPNIKNQNDILQYVKEKNECYKIQYEIMKKNKKLEQIFILKTEIINYYALSLLIIIIIDFTLQIILTIIIICGIFIPNLLRINFCICLICIIAFVIYGIVFSNLYFFFELCLNYFQDDTRIYVDFLQCSNVNKNGFHKYSNLEKLKSHFNIFLVLNIIYLFLCFLKKE